jgi:hypothetical protein
MYFVEETMKQNPVLRDLQETGILLIHWFRLSPRNELLDSLALTIARAAQNMLRLDMLLF